MYFFIWLSGRFKPICRDKFNCNSGGSQMKEHQLSALLNVNFSAGDEAV